MPGLVDRPPLRLEVRIRWLLIGLAVVVTAVFTLGGWLVLIEAEDFIQRKFLLSVAEQAAKGQTESELPTGVTRYRDPAALAHAYGLLEVPTVAGVYEIFTDEKGQHGFVMDGWRARLRLWFIDSHENEHLLWVGSGPVNREPLWIIIDLSDREYSETHLSKIEYALAILAIGVVIGAWMVSRVITRWALRPVLLLADRVQRREVDHDYRAADPLGQDLSADEIGYLARVLDQYHARLRDVLVREQRFLSDCSHELRTPLTVLSGATALMREQAGNPEARSRLLGRMERAVTRMQRLVQTFLMLARERRLPESNDRFYAAEVIHEVINEWRSLHPAHPLKIEVAVEEGLTLGCHREPFLVLCHNLIGNVFSHVPSGTLVIAGAIEEAGTRLTFADDGPGLPEFGGAGLMQSKNGYGLGLSLTERICSTQNWQIQKEPGGKGGTRITVWMPRV